MIEVIDNDGMKRMARVLCGLQYQGSMYVLYFIKRDKESVNIFGSKVILNSEGVLVMDERFSDEEKDWMEHVSRRMFNKDSIEHLKKDEIHFIKDMDLNDGVNRFVVNRSYIATVSNDDISVVLMYYDLEGNDAKSVIKLHESKKKMDGEVWKNMSLIILGMVVLSICIYFIISVLIK